MGRVFKDEEFAKRARRAKLSDEVLRAAVTQADAGIIAAQLGGELIKLRIARPGGGKSGGFRTILAYRRDDRAFFIHFFPKNETDNIDSNELADLKAYAKILLHMTDQDIEKALTAGAIEETHESELPK